MTTKSSRWTKPRRIGNLFCSSWCGHGCTWAQHEMAHRNAKLLASQLGKEWKTRVWENLGRHYAAISPCGRIKVHQDSQAHNCTAFLGYKDHDGGYWVSHSKTPRRAVADVIKEAKASAARLQAVIEGL